MGPLHLDARLTTTPCADRRPVENNSYSNFAANRTATSLTNSLGLASDMHTEHEG